MYDRGVAARCSVGQLFEGEERVFGFWGARDSWRFRDFRGEMGGGRRVAPAFPGSRRLPYNLATFLLRAEWGELPGRTKSGGRSVSVSARGRV